MTSAIHDLQRQPVPAGGGVRPNRAATTTPFAAYPLAFANGCNVVFNLRLRRSFAASRTNRQTTLN